MIHTIAELMWNPFLNVVEYGSAAYVIGKGILGTLRDLVDVLIYLLE